MTTGTAPATTSGRLGRLGRRAAGRMAEAPRLGPSPFGHRSLIEDLAGLAEVRAEGTSKAPRPGAGTRVGTDPRAVTSPLAYTSPRVLISPRAFADPRGTTGIRAVMH